MLKKLTKGLLSFILLTPPLLWISCSKTIDYPSIGMNVSGPTAVANLNDTNFYVLNSNFDQAYETGSILVLDNEGKKVGVVKTPRLGSVLKVAGNVMIAGFSRDVEKNSSIHVYDISDPTKPELKKSFTLKTSSPINVALAEGYDHFAVTCSNGDLHIGTLSTPDLTKSSLKLVREYKYPRRAIYLYKENGKELVFAFPTYDYGVLKTYDVRLVDKKSFTEDGEENVPNDIPDEMENNEEEREHLEQRYPFQFIVYNIAEERANGFKPKQNKDVLNEFRWSHFKLLNSDGKPDYTEDKDATKKFYRTNFWAAAAVPGDANSFYLTHRNPFADSLKKGNDVIKVTLKPGNFEEQLLREEMFDVERVYGFVEEQPEKPFPSAIVAQTIGNKSVLLINHFNNLNVSRDHAKFSLAQKTEAGALKRYELEGQPPDISYYEMAMMSDGRVLAGSFYGNMVLLFDVSPSSSITGAKITKIK